MEKAIEMIFDDWELKYKPIKNPVVDTECFDGLMFETFSPEVDYIKGVFEKAPLTVWTLLETDNGKLLVVSGFHYVNRLGYFVTEIPYIENELIEIDVEIPDDNWTVV